MLDTVTSCSRAAEDVFGPIVASSCLRGFDFTLLFEETILTILPLSIAILLAPFRVLELWKSPVKIRKSWLLISKLATFVIYLVLQISLLALWTDSNIPKTRASLATVGLTFAGFILFAYLSYLEHLRSVQPSTLLSLYLGVSSMLDLARVRTLFLISGRQTIAGLFVASFSVKLVILFLEISEKHNLVLPPWEDASREATSSIYNRSLFIWLNRLFFKGFRTLLTVDTLLPLDDELLSASKPLELTEKWEKADKSSDDALLWTVLFHYRWNLISGILPRLAYTGFVFAQPFLVQRVLDFIAEPIGPNTNNIGYGLLGAYALVYIGIGLSFAIYQHKTYRVLTMFRGSLITFIFNKTLRTSSSAISDAEAITLMSADIDRIGSNIEVVHDMYASCIEFALCLWLLYRLIGVAMAAPAVFVVVCLILSFPLATAAGNAQTPWLEAIERRLAVTTKALGAMKAIKMAGLAQIISFTMSSLRLTEIDASRRHRLLNVFVTIAFYASSTFAPVWGFGIYILLARAKNETLTESVAFSALSLFQLLEQPLISLVDGVEQMQTIRNSFRRIQEHLMSEEREDPRITPASRQSSEKEPSSRQDEVPLNDMPGSISRLGLEDSKIVARVKDVTAGYSEGKPILKDLNFEIPRGKITMIIGPVGSGKSTLLKLLLGEVPETSGLVMTAFSKAAFSPQSPWISWGTIQQNILGMSIWDKPWYNTVIRACALSTDLAELPDGDQTKTGTRGSRLSGGQQMRVSLARALYSREPVMILDDVLTGLDRTTERNILDTVFGANGLLKQLGSTIVLATNSVSHLSYSDHIIVLDEHGKIAQEGTWESVSAANGYFQQLAVRPPASTSRPELELTDETLHEIGLPDDDEEPDTDRQTGDMKIYAYYSRIVGWWTMAFYLFACATFVFGITFPSIWLQWWTNSNTVHPNQHIGYWLGIYAALGVIALLGVFTADWVFNMIVVPKTSKKFHDLLLTTTMRATTSFLTSTNAGKTTNRFSQDLELIDNDLPQAIDKTIFQVLSAIVSAVLVFVGSSYIAAAIPLCILILWLIQFYYLRTSRQLRLLDIEAKAPLFSQFLETLAGISCIRAFGWTNQYMQRNHEVLNDSQRPYYLLWCIQRWLTLVLDLFVAGLAILLVALATNIHSGSTGFLGVALYNIVSFSTTLQLLVTRWTQLETAIGAINRVRSYVSNTACEDLDGESGDLPENWPKDGAVAFTNVSASYQSSQQPVLNAVNLSIHPGEKIAICGRSGSGKSSLISTLLRMLELETGTITVDGIDISNISRQEVRKRLNTLPQEPFFLHGTIRENVDPSNMANDQRIIDVLQSVHLWDSIEQNGGLDADLSEELLSHGQRQLFCLARAIIKPSSILIMDEATSSVDSKTDELMQSILRTEVKGRTIIYIAHKLHTVLDFDRVVVLEKGHIVEVGNPKELLTIPTSPFCSLYESMNNTDQQETT